MKFPFIISVFFVANRKGIKQWQKMIFSQSNELRDEFLKVKEGFEKQNKDLQSYGKMELEDKNRKICNRMIKWNSKIKIERSIF